ncbi:MAG: Trp biosynthesis-associated membrane protein [Schumannella sp.]
MHCCRSGLASLTIVLALALAGPVFRVILGVLDALLGLCVVLVAGWSLSDPVLASVEALAEATGFTSDADAWSDRIADIAPTGWPYAAIGAGILMIVTGIAIAVTARKWPATGSKYSRVRLATEGGAPADPASDWDALSEGEDPTAR